MDINININDIAIRYNNNMETITFNDVLKSLELSCIKFGLNGLEDLTEKCSSAMFNSVILPDVSQNLIQSAHVFYDPKQRKYIYNNDTINSAINIYILLCNIYDKCICVNGIYSLLFAFNHDMDEILTETQRGNIKSRIDKADNMLQLAKARDSKQSILNLAYNNYKHNWSGNIRENEIKSTTKTLEDIKRERLEKSAARAQID